MPKRLTKPPMRTPRKKRSKAEEAALTAFVEGCNEATRPDTDDPSQMMPQPAEAACDVQVEDGMELKPHGGPDAFGNDENIDIDDQIEESLPNVDEVP